MIDILGPIALTLVSVALMGIAWLCGDLNRRVSNLEKRGEHDDEPD